MPFLAALSAGSALFLLLTYILRRGALRPSEARLRYLAPNQGIGLARDAADPSLLRAAPSSIPALSRWLTGSGVGARWAFQLERANLSLRVGEYFAIRCMTGLVSGVIVLLVLQNTLGFLLAVVVGAVGYMLPSVWVGIVATRRIDAINRQMVEFVELLANGLRAGFAFAQSMTVAAQRIGPPLSTELNRVLVDINLGASTEDALRAMNDRIGSDDLDMVVTAILIQRNTGGNLAEVLERVTETMRDRDKLKGDIKTLTSQQRLAGWILSLWPPVLALIMFTINPSMMKLMWTTTPGLVMLIIWVILTATAMLVYRKILSIDI